MQSLSVNLAMPASRIFFNLATKSRMLVVTSISVMVEHSSLVKKSNAASLIRISFQERALYYSQREIRFVRRRKQRTTNHEGLSMGVHGWPSAQRIQVHGGKAFPPPFALVHGHIEYTAHSHQPIAMTNPILGVSAVLLA